MIEKDKSLMSYIIKFSLIILIVLFILFFITLGLVLNFKEYDEINSQYVYSNTLLLVNFFVFILLIFSTLIFLVLYVYRFVKRNKGKSFKFIDKNLNSTGKLIQHVEIKEMSYFYWFKINLYQKRKEILILSVVLLLSLVLIYLAIYQNLASLLYSTIILISISFLIDMFLIFILPLLKARKDNVITEYDLYDDKIIYSKDKKIKEFDFNSRFIKINVVKGMILIQYNLGEQIIIINYRFLAEKTIQFIENKVK